MNWSEFSEAFSDAERTIRIADNAADRMASMLIGRLRKLDVYTLAKLKRELRNFNPQRRTWKS
jgi:hypothetical protein